MDIISECMLGNGYEKMKEASNQSLQGTANRCP